MLGKNPMKKALIPLLFFIFLASFVSAEVVNDFTAASAKRVSVCSCDSFSTRIVVKNIGTLPAIFTITQEGATDFVTAFPASFMLEPGETRAVSEIFNAPCNVVGNFKLKTHIKTDLNVYKSFEQELVIKRCSNTELRALNNTAVSTCRCEPASFGFVVKNTGNFTDTYSFSVDRFEKYSTIIPSAATMDPGNAVHVSLETALPCKSKGNQAFSFVSSSEKNRETVSAPIVLSINDSCYFINGTVATVKVIPYEVNVTTNATGNATYIGKTIKVLAGILALVVGLLLAAAAVILPRIILKPKKEEKAYEWEKAAEEKKVAVKHPKFPVWLITSLLALVLIIAVLAALIVSSPYFAALTGKNATAINMTEQNVTVAGKNVTMPIIDITLPSFNISSLFKGLRGEGNKTTFEAVPELVAPMNLSENQRVFKDDAYLVKSKLVGIGSKLYTKAKSVLSKPYNVIRPRLRMIAYAFAAVVVIGILVLLFFKHRKPFFKLFKKRGEKKPREYAYYKSVAKEEAEKGVFRRLLPILTLAAIAIALIAYFRKAIFSLSAINAAKAFILTYIIYIIVGIVLLGAIIVILHKREGKKKTEIKAEKKAARKPGKKKR